MTSWDAPHRMIRASPAFSLPPPSYSSTWRAWVYKRGICGWSKVLVHPLSNYCLSTFRLLDQLHSTTNTNNQQHPQWWVIYAFALVLLIQSLSSQGSVVSAIGRGLNAIISAIAAVIETIISAIVTVRSSDILMWTPIHLTLIYHPQVIVTIFDVITDILCCRCCSGRRRSGRRGYYRRRGGFSGGRGTTY